MRFTKNAIASGVLIASSLMLVACGGDDGRNGAQGPQGIAGSDGQNGSNGSDGQNGSDGINSLISQHRLPVGDLQCFDGGLRIDSGLDDNGDGVLDTAEVDQSTTLCDPTQLNDDKNFNRIATYAVCQQLDASCDTDTETAAEIVAASEDGNVLIYTDSPSDSIGFVDITTPDQPTGLGSLPLGGEPTSVAVKGGYALVGVNTSADFVNVSGKLAVVDNASRSIVQPLDLAGQPDSVAGSPVGRYGAAAIENERDEDLGNGEPPQLPAGSVDIVDIAAADPASWAVRNVALTGLATLFPEDPEPEYVDINADNIAVVTLQENNHLVLIDLTDGSIVNHFSAGAVDLNGVDTREEELALISQVDSLSAFPVSPMG